MNNGTTEWPRKSPYATGQRRGHRSFDISVMRTGTEFKQIGVRLNRSGTLDLYYGDTAVYRGLALPGFTRLARAGLAGAPARAIERQSLGG